MKNITIQETTIHKEIKKKVKSLQQQKTAKTKNATSQKPHCSNQERMDTVGIYRPISFL